MMQWQRVIETKNNHEIVVKLGEKAEENCISIKATILSMHQRFTSDIRTRRKCLGGLLVGHVVNCLFGCLLGFLGIENYFLFV